MCIQLRDLNFTPLLSGSWPALIENKDDDTLPWFSTWGHGFTNKSYKHSVIHALQVKNPTYIEKWYTLYLENMQFLLFFMKGEIPLSLRLAS